VVRVERTGSTSSDVAAALQLPEAPVTWPHLSVLVAAHQADGRGRAGRTWQTPPGSALTASVVLRPGVSLERWSWLSMIGGLAVLRAVRRGTGLPVALKWPNDVLVVGAGEQDEPGWGRDRKVAGVLVDVVRTGPHDAAAVVGLGVNLEQAAEDLPVPWATSLAAAGVPPADRDARSLLDAVGHELAELLGPWQDAAGDAVASGVLSAVADACLTLGQGVHVTLPDRREVRGVARTIASDGALVVAPAQGPPVRVTAGDVGHVRLSRV
jgi:BirA family biotin operon repressor/biotin-[acetyl-CoA-carboxylase] ligase